ncbi:sporulation protein [Risungbinella massiliensis]|uniref:sporulation protein n=1 Tax=Risungbinella massiliensis TaxID=1329796 RepID=UPI0005CC5972|nr:sporulation protein [Risungbinella massiliensis]
MLDRLKASLQLDGMVVDTVLQVGDAIQGGSLAGEVQLTGGAADQTINRLELTLVSINSDSAFYQATLSLSEDPIEIKAREHKNLPFTMEIPSWFPSTYYGSFRGSLFTHVDIEFSFDSSDIDKVVVEPHPALAYLVDQMEKEVKLKRRVVEHEGRYQSFQYDQPEELEMKLASISIQYHGEGKLILEFKRPKVDEFALEESKFDYVIGTQEWKEKTGAIARFVKEKIDS